MKFALLPLALAALLTSGWACSDDEEESEAGSTPEASAGASATEQAAKPTTESVELRDPVEDAFTVRLPKGWNNRAYSARAYDVHRMVSISVSPEGDTLLFRGDPSMPNYWTPEGSNPMTYEFAKVNPLIKIQPYQSADVFFPAYVKRKFGKLDQFRLGEFVRTPDTEEKMVQAFANAGMQIEASCGKQYFSFTDKGKATNAVIIGSIASMGTMYTIDVGGISTTGKPEQYEGMLTAIRSSEKMNPAWQQKQQQLHEQRMAQIQAATQAMTAQHNRNMAWIQNSAARHQERMQAIWAQNDASMNAYWERSAASDLSHQRFLNYINDENTVVSSNGKTFQVDNSYQTYFMKKSDNSYIGGDSTWDVDTLRKMGLNPDDYEQVKIKP